MNPIAGVLPWLGIAAGFAAAIEIARRLALATGAVAHPNPIVRTHRRPVPYLGGPALILAWIAILIARGIAEGASPSRETLARFACAFVLAAVGTWDDLRAMGPRVKFAVQLAVCAAFLVATGPASPALALLQLLVLVTLVNAFNLIDVMDGLLCVVTAIALAGLLGTPGLAEGAARGEIAVLLAGAAILFLFNGPPARIYSGDAGSMTLGFLVGTWILGASEGAPPLGVLALVGLCAAPALELLLLVPARLQRGLSPFRGSPDHYSLRLQDQRGWSKRRVLAVTIVVGSIYALAPLVAQRAPTGMALALAGLAIASGAALWLALWRLPPQAAKDAPRAASLAANE